MNDLNISVIPYGLVVRIPAFHAGGPGSIPGVGNFLTKNLNFKNFPISLSLLFFFVNLTGCKLKVRKAEIKFLIFQFGQYVLQNQSAISILHE